jgi:hypothetical protein
MYEIRCIVGDKKLREVLVFLNNNNTLEPPVVIPVGLDRLNGESARDTAIKGAMVKPTNRPQTYKKQKKSKVSHGGWHKKGTGSVSVIRAFIEKNRTTHISAREMRDATVLAGYSPNAYSHAVKLLLADNTIFPEPGIQGLYKIVKHAPASHSSLHEVSQNG